MPILNQQTEPWADNAPQPRLSLTFSYGLNENPTPDGGECSFGYNFDLAPGNSALVPRAPFDLKGTATNAGAINSIMQLVKTDNTQTTLVVAGNTVYLWDGASSFTSKGTVTSTCRLRACNWALGNYLVISDVALINPVSQWDGSTFSALTTGLGSTLYAKYAIVHLNRVWLFNIKYGSTTYPHMILTCAFENPTSFDIATRGGPSSSGGGIFSTGLEAFYLLTPDLKPINGVSLFQDQLILSTENGRCWRLTGSSSKDFLFSQFYDTLPALGTEALVDIGNDVLFVSNAGEITLLSVALYYGNVFTSHLSFWIPDTSSLITRVNQIVYDVANQKVLIFLPNQVLVLFKNMMPADRSVVLTGKSPWSLYITDDASQFNTNAAAYIQIPGSTSYAVFWGDSTGRVFQMDGSGQGDAGANPIRVYRRSRHIGTEILNPWPWTQENITGHVRYRRKTPINLTLEFLWDDEYSTTSTTLSLKGPTASDSASYWGGAAYWGGAYYWNQGFNFVNRVSSMTLDPGGKGPGFYINTSFSTNVACQIDSVEID